MKRLAALLILVAFATPAAAGGIQLDISTGFNYDVIAGGEESKEGVWLGTNTDPVGGGFWVERSRFWTCPSAAPGGKIDQHDKFTGNSNTMVVNGVEYHGWDYNYEHIWTATGGLPSDGVITSASGLTYDVAHTQAQIEIPDIYTAPHNHGTVPNSMFVGWNHRTNSWHHDPDPTFTATATLPVAQRASYPEVNFVIASPCYGKAGSDGLSRNSQIKLYANYTTGPRELLHTGSYNDPLTTTNADRGSMKVLYQMTQRYGDNCGDPVTGTISLYEFAVPLDLDETRDLLGFTLEAASHDNYQYAGYFIMAATAIPEPATMTLLGLGLLGLTLRRRRK